MILFWKKNYFWDTLYWPLTTFILLSGMNTMYLSTWGLEFTLDTFSLVSLELGNGSLTFGLKMWQLPIEWNLQGNQGKFLETNILYSQKNFLNTFSFYKMPPFSRLFVLLNQSFFLWPLFFVVLVGPFPLFLRFGGRTGKMKLIEQKIYWALKFL